MPERPFWLKPHKLTLTDGATVTLRPETASDLEKVWEMFNSLSMETLRFIPGDYRRERIESWFTCIDYDKILPICAHVETPEGPRVVATSTLAFHEPQIYRHKATFGITVHDDYQNRGLGTQITRYMVEIARAKGLKKVELYVVTPNQRAIKVYERCGFQVEGLLRRNHWNPVRGEYGDDYVMGLLLD